MSKHKDERADEMIKLSSYAYGGNNATPPAGWQQVGDAVEATGYRAVVLRNDVTKEVVVAFRGTNPEATLEGAASVGANLSVPLGTLNPVTMSHPHALLGGVNPYMGISEKLMDSVSNNLPPGYKLMTTGHSQGGMIAHYMGTKFDVPSVGINSSPGNDVMNKIYAGKDGSATHVDIHARTDHAHDPVSNIDNYSMGLVGRPIPGVLTKEVTVHEGESGELGTLGLHGVDNTFIFDSKRADPFHGRPA